MARKADAPYPAALIFGVPGAGKGTQGEILTRVPGFFHLSSGVIFRKLVQRERTAPPWREMLRVLRRMEDRGELRGGRFVSGVWGEQFALPNAIPLLRAQHKQAQEANAIDM